MSHADAAARPRAGRSQADKLARLRGASIGLVAMLVIQFILGMIYNLYGTAPTSKKSIGLFSGPVIALHVVLGILLFVAAVVHLIRAIGARHSLSIWLSAIGLVSIIEPASRGSASPAAVPPALPWACRSRSRSRWSATSPCSWCRPLARRGRWRVRPRRRRAALAYYVM